MLGGKATHPVWGLPGGVSKSFTEDERKEVEQMAESCVAFAKTALAIFEDAVLKNKEYRDLIVGDIYAHQTYYMGLVDPQGKVNFYEGKVRVVTPEGKVFAEFPPAQYLDHIEECVEPWTYLKFPYLKKIGWKGLQDGKESGIYRVNTLARLNVADGMATEGAQAEYEKFYETFGTKPVHATLAYHWARLIELLYASERLLELSRDSDVTSKDIRAQPQEPEEGVGCVEAPRGTLFHHYKTDKEGIVQDVNLLVATCHNNGAICMSIKKAAQRLIRDGKVDDKLLNMVEMAFRAYDPCFACATHALPGDMPLEVNLYDHERKLYKRLARGF
jgi:F420-non-reducing hydrogenase large subunit